MPDFLACRQIKSNESPTSIRDGLPPIGNGEIGSASVRSAAPFDAAFRPSFADARPPDNFPIAIRIKRIDNARFLGGKNQAVAIRQRRQNRRSSKVIVVTIIGRSIYSFLRIGPEAGESPPVVGRGLARP
jgi:hypothetical protein